MYAITAAVTADRHTDIDALIEDLTDEHLGTVVHGLAALAMRGFLPDGVDPIALSC